MFKCIRTWVRACVCMCVCKLICVKGGGGGGQLRVCRACVLVDDSQARASFAQEEVWFIW